MARSYLCPASINIYKLMCIPCDPWLRHSDENSTPYVNERNRTSLPACAKIPWKWGGRWNEWQVSSEDCSGAQAAYIRKGEKVWDTLCMFAISAMKKDHRLCSFGMEVYFLKVSILPPEPKCQKPSFFWGLYPCHADGHCHLLFLYVLPCFLQCLDVHQSDRIRVYPHNLIHIT